MNDFEAELKKQKPKGIPSHWRQQILAAAEREATVEKFANDRGGLSWRNLFWPSPRIWAGLGVAWIVILFLNLNSGLSSSAVANSQVATAPASDGIEERRRLMAELLGPVSEPATAIPFVPRRRSEGVSEFRVV
jgi:hypothetical protein